MYARYRDRLQDYERKPWFPTVHQMWLVEKCGLYSVPRDESHVLGYRFETKDKYIDTTLNIPDKEARLSYDVELNLPAPYPYKFWTSKDICKLWELPELQAYKESFYKAEPHIIRCDMARYAIMYAEGGIYMDMDSILTDKPLVADRSRDQIYYYEDDKKTKIYNGYLVSRPNNPFWLLLLDIICEKLTEKNYIIHSIPEVYATSGPEMLGKTVATLVQQGIPNIEALPQSEFPIKIDQPSMSSWKAELVKHEVQSTGNQWYWILLVLLPILFLLIFIMWYWSRNAQQREMINRLNKEYPGYRFS